MKDDYLWSGSGEPDPEIQRLETALSRFRFKNTPLGLAAIRRQAEEAPRPRSFRIRSLLPIAAAAAITLTAASIGLLVRRPNPALSEVGWNVTRLTGTPYVGSKPLGKASDIGALVEGRTLETDSQARASIAVDGIGEVEVEPDTRVRLIQRGSAQKQLALDRGTIRALIWAPPGEFMVNTRSAMAVDMGCAYTLQVDDAGAGLLRTALGWVGFKSNGRESFIPAGAACAMRPGIGPGTPYFEDASEPFRAALSRLDFEAAVPEQHRAELGVVLAQARRRDAITLWHLLTREDGQARGRVYAHLQALAPAPAGVTRQGILALDQKMLDLWWNELDLGDISLWRTWERTWSQRKLTRSDK